MNGEVTQTDSAPAETSEVSQPSQETSQEVQQTEVQKPDGFDPVDVKTATPEQIEARMNRLYGNMKRYETAARKVPELEQANQILADQIRSINETQSKVINHLHITDYQEAEQSLKAQRQEAWKSGNSQLYDDINDKLRDLTMKRATAEMEAKFKPQQIIQQPQMRPVNGEAVIDLAVKQGAVTSDEATVYRSWMGETDDSGTPKRPWVSENDPRNMAAASEGRAVFNNPVYSHLTFAQKLQEIDRRMGVKMATPQGQNVLPSGNLTRSVKNNNIKLTDYEAKIAEKTKFGGPKAKSNADHHEAYRQAKIKSQQKGASR